MNILGFKTLTDFTDHFRDEKTCVEHYTASRFRNGEYCPYCQHDKIYKYTDSRRYRCAGCRRDFTIRTGTLFGDSPLPLRKWYIAVYLMTSSGKGVSSVQLAKQIGVTQKTAWFMAHRIRAANRQSMAKLMGTIEADETFVGGKAKNMHAKIRRVKITGTSGTNKMVVFGMKTREGQVRAQVVQRVDAMTLHPVIRANVAAGSTLYSDEHRAYAGLKEYRRGIVRHGVGEYVVGDCTTNGIESFWAVFKRGYHGVYHWMSRKHLQRYVNEFVCRFNLKGRQLADIFADAVQRIASTPQLTYKALTLQL